MDGELDLEQLGSVQAGYGSNKESMLNYLHELEAEYNNTNDPDRKQEIAALIQKLQTDLNEMLDAPSFGGR